MNTFLYKILLPIVAGTIIAVITAVIFRVADNYLF
jgi:hypothetical protein